VEDNTHLDSSARPGIPTSARRWLASFSASWHSDVLVIALLTAVVAVAHLGIPGAVPSGADGGNWLAIAKESLGSTVMSAEVSYLPVFPGIVALLLLVVGSIQAVVVAALISKAVLVTSIYLATRTLGRGYALVAAIMVAVAGAQMEAYAWGGYAQLLGMAFGLLGVFLILRYIDTREPVNLWSGVAAAVAAVLTHTLIGGLFVGAVVVSAAHWLFIVDAPPRAWKRGMGVALAIAIPAGLFVLVSVFVGLGSGVEPVLNPFGLGWFDALGRAIRDAPVPWALVGLAGLAVLFSRNWLPHVATTVALGSSWAAVGLAFFLLTGEPRALLVVQIGMILLAVAGFASVYEYVRIRSSTRHAGGSGRVSHRAVVFIGVTMLAAIVAGGLGSYSSATDWYRVIDLQELSALDRLREVSRAGDIVVAAKGHHGNPVGWWVEGYAERPTLTGLDSAFLAFPDERSQAETANRIFSGGLSYEAISRELLEVDAQFLVVDRRGPHSSWLDSEYAQSLAVVHDESNLVVLEAQPSG